MAECDFAVTEVAGLVVLGMPNMTTMVHMNWRNCKRL